MKEINNQRKAFLDMQGAGVVEESITDVRKPEIAVMTSLCGELFTDYSDHPRKLVTLNPKLKSTGMPDATSFFPVGGILPQAAWPENFSPKSQDAVALQQIKERGALISS